MKEEGAVALGERLTISIVPIVASVTALDLCFLAQGRPDGLGAFDAFATAAPVASVHAMVAGVVVVVALAWRRALASVSGLWARVMWIAPTLVSTAIAGALNLDLALRRPLLVAAALVGFAILHGLTMVVSSRASGHWRWLGAAIGIGLLVLNGLVFVDVNPRQHQALVFAAWCVLLPPAYAASRLAIERLYRRAQPRSVRLFRWVLVLGWICVMWFARSMSLELSAQPLLRFEVRRSSPAAAATLQLSDEFSDWDRDGFPSWFGGGDCAPLDAEVHPLAREYAGDGIDQNCMAGDPSQDEVDELRRSLAGPRSPPQQREPIHRIVLITGDALRFDAKLPRLGARLGSRCKRFTRAYTTNPATTYAVYGLFASRFPSQGRYTRIGSFNVPTEDPAPRLPQLLADQGWATAAIAFHHRFHPKLGLTRGFEDVWTVQAKPEITQGIAGVVTTDQALAWASGHDPPYLLWVHYYDPHAPYLPHGDPSVGSAREAYDAEVAFTDREMSRLIAGLPAVDETAVIVAADHGEAFGEHGASFHATSLYDEQIRIPLWVCGPGEARGQSHGAAASIVDIAPTILDWAALPVPSQFMGRSLLTPFDPIPIFAETAGGSPPAQAVMDGGWKLIRYLRADARLLFSLQRDPAERLDLSSVEPEELDRLARLLDQYAALSATSGD